ncbi:MAG: hypothetical protein ABJC26_04415 [Gemmatimonadaceae bacterium]
MKALRKVAITWATGLLLVAAPAKILVAQGGDTLKAPPKTTARTDSTKRAPRQLISRALIAQPSKPPLTPKQAFVYSLILPGLGQSRLDRGSAGAFFALIELGSLAMVQKSKTDLNEARKFSGDSLPANYAVDATGKITGTGSYQIKFPVALVNTRRLHVEDWFAALAFNHLMSGADAYVAAHLWEVPASLSVVPRRDGAMLVATVRW